MDIERLKPELITADACWLVTQLNLGNEAEIKTEVQLWSPEWVMAVSDLIHQSADGKWKIKIKDIIDSNENLDSFDDWEPEPPSSPEDIEYAHNELAWYLNYFASIGDVEKLMRDYQSKVDYLLTPECLAMVKRHQKQNIVERLFKIGKRKRKRPTGKGFG